MPTAYQTYANLQDRVEQFLQDPGALTYTTTMTDLWIEEALKGFSDIIPHIITVIFKVESRHGIDVTGTASSLTDSVKSQFLSTDPTNEKVIHNITDNTWAVVEGFTNTSVLTLSADIMDANEQYEIYDKRCWNERQIYIGDMAPFIGIIDVRYPLSIRGLRGGRGLHEVKRDFMFLDDKIEIDVSWVHDSDPTLSPPRDADVYVRFAAPHQLTQLADLAGAVHTEGALAATSLQVKDFTDTEIVEIGDEFHIADQRTLYKVTTGVTLATQSGAGSQISFYPPLEAVASVSDVITFRKSTLRPQHENILFKWICGLALQSESFNRINAISPGGTGVYERFESKGLRLVAEAKDEAMREYDVDLWAETSYSRGRQLSEL